MKLMNVKNMVIIIINLLIEKFNRHLKLFDPHDKFLVGAMSSQIWPQLFYSSSTLTYKAAHSSMMRNSHFSHYISFFYLALVSKGWLLGGNK